MGSSGTSSTDRIRGRDEAESHSDLRFTLVAVPAAMGSEWVPGFSGCQSGDTVRSDRKSMKQGMGYDALPWSSFVLGGPANTDSGWYNFQKSNISPRISVAYSPRPHGGWLRNIFGEAIRTVNSRTVSARSTIAWNAIAQHLRREPSRRIGCRRFKTPAVPLAMTMPPTSPHNRHSTRFPLAARSTTALIRRTRCFFSRRRQRFIRRPTTRRSPGESISR